MPYPPNRGDRIRSYHLLKYMAGEADVSLATLADEPVEKETMRVLGSLTKRMAIQSVNKSRWIRGAMSLAAGKSATAGLFSSGALKRAIREWGREKPWDAVLVYCSSMVPYLDTPELAGVPAVVDLVDVDSQKFIDYAELSSGVKRWLYRLEARRLRKLECSLPARAQAITLVSEAEAELYRSFCPNDRTLSVPNGVDLDYFRPGSDGSNASEALPEKGRTNLVFVGALDYHANVDGITWFVREVWPLVRRVVPHVTLSLVGRNPVPAVKRLAHEAGVRVFANVPDVRPYVAAADVAIAPLRIARGVQNKVLEALAMGKRVVGSPQALEGISGAGSVTLVAATREDWAQILGEMLNGIDGESSYSHRARAFAERHCSWSAAGSAVMRLIKSSRNLTFGRNHSVKTESMRSPGPEGAGQPHCLFAVGTHSCR